MRVVCVCARSHMCMRVLICTRCVMNTVYTSAVRKYTDTPRRHLSPSVWPIRLSHDRARFVLYTMVLASGTCSSAPTPTTHTHRVSTSPHKVSEATRRCRRVPQREADPICPVERATIISTQCVSAAGCVQHAAPHPLAPPPPTRRHALAMRATATAWAQVPPLNISHDDAKQPRAQNVPPSLGGAQRFRLQVSWCPPPARVSLRLSPPPCCGQRF